MNAKEEFLEFVKGKEVLCARIYYEDKIIDLAQKENAQKFLSELDFEYNEKSIYGVIWFKDGSWGRRTRVFEEEYWILERSPKIPSKLLLQ